MSLVEHLRELRTRLFWCALAITVGSVIAFIFRDQVLDVIIHPYVRACEGLNAGKLADELADCNSLVVLSPTEPFNITLKLAALGGLVFASPMIFTQLWLFVAPGLTREEKRWAVPFITAAVFFFLLGIGFAYLALERGLGFLLGFAGENIELLPQANEYFSFALTFVVVFGIAFEFPLLVLLLSLLRVVSSQQLAKARPWAVVAIFVIGAVVTPSGDPYTLLAMGLPLIFFYEAAIWVSRLVFKR